ncbi:hypothetical protein XENOCAPTIV_008877, partial [Xenoophorus captivus]
IQSEMCEEWTHLMSPPHHQVGEDADPEDGTEESLERLRCLGDERRVSLLTGLRTSGSVSHSKNMMGSSNSFIKERMSFLVN